MARRAIRTAYALVATLFLVTLTGCGDSPDPRAAAEDLARALASGDLTGVSWSGASPSSTVDETRTLVFAGLPADEPTVRVATAVRTKNTTAVRLEWAWDLGVPATTWSYSTSATMTLVNGTWVATWSPSLLAPALAAGEMLSAVRSAAPRGQVLGADGQAIEEPRAVLGTVGEASARIAEQSGGAIVAGDLTGLSGLQRQHDEQLRGVPGWEVRATAHDGAERVVFRADPVPGADLRTTIDPALEKTAADLLAEETSVSALVAIRPSTGELLAVASGPGGGGLSTATVGRYAPGSTFTIVSALALLRSGLSVDATVPCLPSVTVDGKAFANSSGYPASATGPISLTTAFARSCTTAFSGAGERLTDADLVAAARSLGLDHESEAGFGAFLGSLPDGTDAAGRAAVMVGQGQVLVSPLGMATVLATVSAGQTVSPRIVADAPVTVSPVNRQGGTGAVAVPLTTDETVALRALLRASAERTPELSALVGDDLLAMTGTAELVTADGTVVDRVWTMAATGDLAVVVFVEVGDLETVTAESIMAAFLAAAAG
ncbi:MAG: penicillin-binding transpeptidase domain-containing protein [Micrococcales bacterium]|nr:penicillin-binding transpeptidase domain-containing protein [Micrococcales bacterium]